MKKTVSQSATMVVETYNLPMSVKEYLRITAIIQEDLFPHAKVLPGVEKLIRHLHAHDIPIAVATSSTRSKFQLKTSLNKELFELFDVIICGDDAEIKNGKPSPDLFLAAQKHLGNPPAENCLVFEDAVNGVQAGLNANMNVRIKIKDNCMCTSSFNQFYQVVWIPDENIKELSGETDHGATIVLKSMADLVPEQFGLPPFKQ